MGNTRFGTEVETYTGNEVAFTGVSLADKVTVTTLPPDPSAPSVTLGDDIFTKFSDGTTKSTKISSSTATSPSTKTEVTSSSTAGMAMITAKAQWALGGVAVGLAML